MRIKTQMEDRNAVVNIKREFTLAYNFNQSIIHSFI